MFITQRRNFTFLVAYWKVVKPRKLLSNLPFKGYLLITWLLIKKWSALRFMHFGDFNNSQSVQLLGGNNIDGRGGILLYFLWFLIFYLHILTIFHCEIWASSICINVGFVCIDYITSFFITNLVAKAFGSKLAKNYITKIETFSLASNSFTL